jgi:hypothetical protein
MYNFDLRKYLAEGKLREEEDTRINPQVDILQQALGVKVTQSYTNSDRLVIYPDSAPDREKYYDSRSAQTINILAKDGKYHFSSAGGYGRSIQPIAQYLGAEVRGNTGIAGRAAVDVSLNKPSISIKELKQFIAIMQQGLKDESRAEADFYKGWSNPD